MAERTCIVTREVGDPAHLIRFVADPDGRVVPDLKRALPGRGVWVTARRDLVDEAVSRRAFARGLKASVTADESLGARVDGLMEQSALGALGFARKAGECVTGSGKVETLIRKGRAIALLHASDGAEDGLRKLQQAIRASTEEGDDPIPVLRPFTAAQLNLSLGGTNVVHAALSNGGAARNCLRQIERLLFYRNDPARWPESGPVGPQNWTAAPNRAKDTANAQPDAGLGRKDRNI